MLGQGSGPSLSVEVKDELGNTVRGARVTIRSPRISERSLQTDERGRAEFRRLSIGEYSVIVTAFGFKEHRSDRVQLADQRATVHEVILDIAPIESEVDVGADDVSSPETAGAAIVMNEREIQNLPDDQTELERAIRALGATVGDDLPITVDGIQGGQIPPKAAIQQIRVNNNVYSAQFDNPFGGGIEIFTRSTADRIRGWVNYSFADSAFNASDPFLGRKVPFRSHSFFGSLTGPLLSKKATFFVNVGFSDSATSSPVNAIILNSNIEPVEFKVAHPAPTRSESLNFVINADPNKKHKLYLSFGYSGSQSSGQNVGGFSLPSRENNSRFANHIVQFSDTFLVNPNVVSQTKAFFNWSRNKSFGGTDAFALNVSDAFFGGGSQQNSLNTNARFDVSNDTTWQLGKYAMGIGVRVRREGIDQNSTANFGGTYTFTGRNAPVLDANNQPVINPDGSIALTQITSLEAYRRTLLFRQLGLTPHQIRSRGGGPSQFTISSGDPEIDVGQTDVAVYFQNSYKVSETVAISGGLRYENQSNISSRYNFAPRVGVVWAPNANEKKRLLYALPRISLGYGVFYSRYSLNNTLGLRLAGDQDRRQYLVTETAILDIFPNVPSIEQLEHFALPRTRRQLAGDFDTPLQHLFTVTATKRLPGKYTLNSVVMINRSLRQAVSRNINAPLAGTWDPQNPLAAVRPFGNVGNIFETQADAVSRTERVTFTLSFPPSQTLFGNVRYSFTRSRGDWVNGSGSPFDPYDFSQDYGRNASDGVHSFGGYIFYTIGRGFNIGGDLSLNSGTRFNITTGRDTNGDGYFTERPSFASDLTKPGLVATPYGILDPNPSPNDRIIPRNFGRGSPTFYFNANLSKRFTFGEDKANKKPPQQTLSFSIFVRNVFNVINRGNPVGNIASPNFLRTLGGQNDGSITFINGARQVDFVGRSMSFSAGFSF